MNIKQWLKRVFSSEFDSLHKRVWSLENPPKFRVGDKVNLTIGGRTFIVVIIRDYIDDYYRGWLRFYDCKSIDGCHNIYGGYSEVYFSTIKEDNDITLKIDVDTSGAIDELKKIEKHIDSLSSKILTLKNPVVSVKFPKK